MPDNPSDTNSRHDLIEADWSAPPNVRAFSTTRHGGFSKGAWGQFNLGAHCGDHPDNVAQNRELLSALLPSNPPWLRQVHGTEVGSWNDMHNDPDSEADALVSSQSGQVCAVLTADCLPLFFCNKAGTKVAAVHAGWRGLAAGILESTVLAMDNDPSQLMAWMGPAIGPQAFEVGQDVYDKFTGLNPENRNAFKPHKDRWFADLYELARMALSRVGVERVYGGQYCTYSEPKRFFSYRRDGITGRMASLIWLDS
jgi:YfiH family protein